MTLSQWYEKHLEKMAEYILWMESANFIKEMERLASEIKVQG